MKTVSHERKCPRCGSAQPHMHPAVQVEGEVSVCHHPFHSIVTPQNKPAPSKIGTPEDMDYRAECDRYGGGGSVRRAFVTIIEPGKIPNGKGPFTTSEFLDEFVREALAHHTDPATHVIIHELTWNNELWTECARQRAQIDAALNGVDMEQFS